MSSLSHDDVSVMLLSLGILLAAARILGEVAQWLRQPAVVGELLAGILLGPTVLGEMAPGLQSALFPSEGAVAVVVSGIRTLSITLFLLVAGIEVDLSTVWKQGSTAFRVALLGMVVPFGLGYGCAWLAPELMGSHEGANPYIFSLFFATALSISALPVIAKILMDLNLYRSDLGMVIISAAMLDDVVGWIIFAIVLGMIGAGGIAGGSIGVTIALTLLFAGAMLTVGRWWIHRLLPYIQAYTHWPGGVMSFCLTLALFSAALTEWIGIHAIFGAFLVGVAIGDSSHLRERTRGTIENFVSFFFAPLFFGGLGLRINFWEHFHWPVVLAVLAIACAGKLIGCLAGAKWAGMSRRDGWAVAFGMNARGAMEIVLGTLALEAGVIRNRLFVALVVMAVVTSMIGGPLAQWVLGRRKPRRVVDFLSAQRFVRLQTSGRTEVITQLVAAACTGTAQDPVTAQAAVLEREAALHTGLGRGVAIPHARIAGLPLPLLALGVSQDGVDFDAPDGLPAHVICLLLTPLDDDGAQLEILASLARTFRDSAFLDKLRRAVSYTEALALLKSAAPSGEPVGEPPGVRTPSGPADIVAAK